ncbi:MAG: precorrin-4 C(11)-methyltransferase [Planctomycetes bacterium]|nr:precorrin-4 C(11)-methyltransferase [Planctomycetota bacterium]
MKVYFTGAGPGDPELLTVRARRLLSECKCCVYAGSLVSPEVIGLIPSDAEVHDSAGMSLGQILAVCKDARGRDVDVVRLHTGDPAIYGAIGEQMAGLDGLGIEYEVVPGVSSFQAAAAALKTELTVPGISQTIILTRSAGRTPMPESQELDRLAQAGATLCIFLSVHGIEKVATILSSHYGKEAPAAVVYRASWPDEIIIRGTLDDIARKVGEAGIKKTAMIIVGNAPARPGTASKLYDSTFTHGYRKGKKA